MPKSKVASDTLVIDKWETPWSSVPSQQVGNARLKHRYLQNGIYGMEGIDGYEYFYVPKRIKVTTLERRQDTWEESNQWNEWMIDDPLHWYGMREICNRLPAGRVVCAGLGLGLMVHHLLARKDITAIHVVELDPDVIRLVSGFIPHESRLQIHTGDFYEWIRTPLAKTMDSVLWDLAVGKAPKTTGELLVGSMFTTQDLPGIPLFQFGLKGRNHFLE